MKLRPAYTLLEMLVVITLFALLLGWSLVDYRQIGARQAVRLQAESLQALVQQSHAEVRAGRIRDNNFLCQGLYFKVGAPIQEAVGVYVPENDACEQQEFFAYGNTKTLTLQRLTVGGTELSEAWAFFVPPDAEFRLFDAFGMYYPGEVEFSLQSENDESELELSLPLQGFPLTVNYDS